MSSRVLFLLLLLQITYPCAVMLVTFYTILICGYILIVVTNGASNSMSISRNADYENVKPTILSDKRLRLFCDNGKSWYEELRIPTGLSDRKFSISIGPYKDINGEIHKCIFISIKPDYAWNKKRPKRGQFSLMSKYKNSRNRQKKNYLRNFISNSTNRKGHEDDSQDLHYSLLYLTATVGGLVLLGSVFYCCAKAIYLQRDGFAEPENTCEQDRNVFTVENGLGNSIPLHVLAMGYTDAPPSYDKSVQDMPPSYEEALNDEKSRSIAIEV